MGYGDNEPKTGVWKIAFADFMTAMMAFFLVMWLMNATNQETKESVATYFNPVKLTDSTPDCKGVNDPKKVDPGKAEEMDSTNPLPIPARRRACRSQARPGSRARTKRRCFAIPTPFCRRLPAVRPTNRAANNGAAYRWGRCSSRA